MKGEELVTIITNERLILCCSLAIILISTLGILINRIVTKKGIGIRAIQFATVMVVFPFLVILVSEGILHPTTIAVVAGTICGYVFSRFEKGNPNDK